MSPSPTDKWSLVVPSGAGIKYSYAVYSCQHASDHSAGSVYESGAVQKDFVPSSGWDIDFLHRISKQAAVATEKTVLR